MNSSCSWFQHWHIALPDDNGIVLPKHVGIMSWLFVCFLMILYGASFGIVEKLNLMCLLHSMTF
jgi:hypothetical protein